MESGVVFLEIKCKYEPAITFLGITQKFSYMCIYKDIHHCWNSEATLVVITKGMDT